MKGGTNRRGMLGRAFMALATMVGMAGGASATTIKQSSNRDAVAEIAKLSPRTQALSKIHGSGDKSPFKVGRTPPKNQKQYREMLRSNPHFAHSKKSKLKQRGRKRK